MTELVKATELSILQYVNSIGLNPEHVYYNRTTTNNKSTANLQWTLIAPASRLLLLSLAEIDLLMPLRKTSILAAGTNEDDNARADFRFADKISFKEGFPLHNATTSITTIVNGATQTMNQPRHWAHKLAMMFGGKKGIKICNPSGGEFYDLNGNYPSFADGGVAFNIGSDASVIKHDNGMYNNEQAFISQACFDNGNTIAGQDLNVRLREKVYGPPFNPFAMVQKDMPDYCWFKHMSPVIGNVSRLEFDYQMANFAPSVLLYRQGIHATGGGAGGAAGGGEANRVDEIKISTITEAGITLYWYKLPDKMVIPRQLIYQTWSVRQFVKSLSAPVINNDAALASQVSDLIQLHSIPTLIVVSVERDRDDATAGRQYVCRSLGSREIGQANRENNTGNNSWDDYAEIESIQIEMGDKTGIITTARDMKEMYYLTLKNSVIKDFPYDYYQWRGRKGQTVLSSDFNGAADNVSFNYPSRCFIAFRPKDLGIGQSDGVQHNITFKITELNLRGRSALPASLTWNHSYRMYVHVFYGKHTLELTPEAGKFSEQRFTLDSVRSIGVGGNIKIRPDDSRYVSRMPKM